ncbi:MAG TPA: hemolysin III family protein [Ilumatobacteraceae bacterium]|jgi:hemolysin III
MDSVGAVAQPAPLTKPLLRGWSHLVAFTAVAVLGALILANAVSTANVSRSQRLWLGIYVFGTLTMFGVSSLYHRLPWRGRGRSVMSRLDHSAIFLAIVGTYTPVMATALHGWQKPAVLGSAWGGAMLGVVVEWLPGRFPRLKAPRSLFTAIYVVVGWSALLALPQLYRGLGGVGFGLVIGGGVPYTTGAVVYAIKRPDPWPRVFGFHEVFHMLTIAGAGTHMAAIAFSVVPRM